MEQLDLDFDDENSLKELTSKKINSIKKYIFTFLKWIVVAGVTGLIGGIVGTLFHISVEYVTKVRVNNDLIIFFLPLGGLVIANLYKISNMSNDPGTNLVISSVRTEEKVPFAMAPLIFISTVITHLFGGSAGREGAALQLGGSIGTQVGNLFRLNQKDMHIVTMCGMSAVFSALFGTPLTATFFSMEVVSIGIIYYSSFIPCIVAALTAYKISLIFGVKPVRYILASIPLLDGYVALKVIILGVLCAVISILFCESLHKTNKFLADHVKNNYIKVIIGGVLVVALTFLCGSRDYNGAGVEVIAKAINGQAIPYAFLLKILFTTLTISFGYKGGEIVPTFFIGATFGCTAAGILGLDPGFGAAIGVAAMFCGVTNSLITSIVLSIELFGSQGLVLFALACGVSYMLSGYYSLYGTQKIVYSKLRAEYVNRDAK